jgi:hypothetical protein
MQTQSSTAAHRAIPWVIHVLRRVPLPYPITTLIIGAILVSVNALLMQWDGAASMRSATYFVPRQIAPPIISVYSLFAMCYLYSATQTMMTKLRPAVRVDDETYTQFTQQMLTVNRRIDAAISIVGTIAALGAFVYQMTAMRGASAQGRFNVLNGVQGLQLALLGLFVGLLVYSGIERALGLYRLMQQPLAINFFDTRNLAPVSQLSLQISLALIGLVSLPIVLFGGAAFVVAVQSLIYLAGGASALIAFALPFWGVYRQMTRARDRELATVEPRLHALYRQLLDQNDHNVVAEINALAHYRAVLKAAPMSPFQSARVVAQAAIPVLLPIISYLLQTRLAPLISDWLR